MDEDDRARSKNPGLGNTSEKVIRGRHRPRGLPEDPGRNRCEESPPEEKREQEPEERSQRRRSEVNRLDDEEKAGRGRPRCKTRSIPVLRKR